MAAQNRARWGCERDGWEPIDLGDGEMTMRCPFALARESRREWASAAWANRAATYLGGDLGAYLAGAAMTARGEELIAAYRGAQSDRIQAEHDRAMARTRAGGR